MIVFVTHPYHRGGVTSWMKDAFLTCRRLGIGTRLVTVHPVQPFISGKGRQSMIEFIGEEADIVSKPVGYSFELGSFEQRVAVYRDLIARHIPPKAVLVPSDDDACWAACCVLGDRYRVIGVLHSDDPHYYDLHRQYGNYLAGLVAVSRRVLRKAANKRLEELVIPCGINLAYFESISKQQQILWVGRLEEEQKRVSDIIPIAKKLLAARADWDIHVYGHGDRLDWLKEQQEFYRLTNLHMHGWQGSEVISSALKEAAILLQTSNYEGMSVAVMEALGAGCAIVSSRVSGVEDLEGSPDAAAVIHLYPVGDTESAVAKIIQLIHVNRDDIPSKAKHLASEHFSIESCVRSYEQFSKDLKPAEVAMPFHFSKLAGLSSKILSTARKIKYQLFN